MYRNRKDMRHLNSEQGSFKTLLMLTGGVLLIAIITFIITMNIYNSKVSEDTEAMLKSTGIASLNTDGIVESASTSIGKTVNEVKGNNIIENNIISNTLNDFIDNSSSNSMDAVSESTSKKDVIYINRSITDSDNTTEDEKTSIQTNANVSKDDEEEMSIKNEDVKNEEKKNLTFIKPVDGEIIREFAKDNLVYSNTLDEWIIHLGIDIKADKTTVVKSAADGVVETIKNDPRYGLTVIVSHDNGFKTIYSNLLTAEYVTEGENVTSGQTIGTVGNNAAFEIADEPHLHFEMSKDNEKVDPKIYIRY